jgi:hypothetical protein
VCPPQLGEGRCDISLAKSGKVCASSKYGRAGVYCRKLGEGRCFLSFSWRGYMYTVPK